MAHCLDGVGQDVANEVRTEIGEYQPGIGPFPPMAPLAESTIDTKVSKNLGKGGDPDTPLYASGAFESDIGHAVDAGALSVEVGTNQNHVIYTEFGTAKQPPRPIFGPAALRILPKIKSRVAAAAVTGLIGISITSHNPNGTEQNIT